MWGRAKRAVFGSGEHPRTVWFGAAGGLRFLIDPAGKTQRIVGLDEAEIGRAFRRAAAVARTFVDVGASDGYYPVIALKHNPHLTAIGCDPQAELERRARENYTLNFPAGGPPLEWVSTPVGNGAGQVRLDDLAADRLGPVLVKVDVDGFEVDVLQSGPKLLARPDCTALVEVHSKELEAATIDLLKGHGFRPRVIPNAWWRVIVPEHRPIELNRWVFADKGAA